MAVARKPPKAPTQQHVRCAYDWQDESKSILTCVAHKDAHTIVRMPSLGHDVLAELAAQGMLAGEAKGDAEWL